jgi:conjugative relaxase-like TrwC/TraI family protein
MLRINVHSSSDAAKSYFDRELKCGDYYANDQEAPGHWGGMLASQLELSGTVDRAAFHRLCDNLLPDESGKLTTRTKANRRIGYDLNFHAPKSLSIAFELTGDDALRETFLEAVRETMGEVEQSAGCRVRQNGVSEDRTTGNLLWGEFLHRTARPVDGVPDPHLHAHVFVFNVTQDAAEGKRKAGQFGTIVENAPTFEAHFHARLAAHVKALGYQTIETKNGWEIAGVPESTRQKFSRRSHQIKDYAEANGITDPSVIGQLGAETRQAKARGQGMENLRRYWQQQLNDAERAALEHLKPDNAPEAPKMTAAAALGFAINHCFERATLMPLHWIIRTALRHAVGAVKPEQLEDAIAANTELVIRLQGNRTLATTHTALREERHFIREVRQARGTVAGLNPGYVPPDNFLREDERQGTRSPPPEPTLLH